MRPSVSLLLLLSISANASWFASDKPAYSAWSAKDLKTWLEAHDVPIPQGTYSQQDLQELVKQNWNSASAWTYDQYASAQKSFADIRDSTFDAWDESRLREFLLQQGVVAPKGPREQLVILAKDKYRDYMNAASLFTSQAGASASSAYYGDTGYQATKSLSSIAARATNGAARVMNDSKDYVYSTWDDNMLRSYLEDKGVIKTKAQMTRGDMLAKMKDAYASVTQPVWDTWSDSYMVRPPHFVRSSLLTFYSSTNGLSITVSSNPTIKRTERLSGSICPITIMTSTTLYTTPGATATSKSGSSNTTS